VMLGELVVSLYIFGVLAASIWLLKLVLDRIVEHFIAHPFPLYGELGCEFAKWVAVIPVIALGFVGVLRLFLFLSLV
jgi:hypothetical protein